MARLYIVFRENQYTEGKSKTKERLDRSVRHLEDVEIIPVSEDAFIETFNELLKKKKDGWILTIDDGDQFDESYISALYKQQKRKDIAYVCGNKSFLWMDKEMKNTRLLMRKTSELFSYTDILAGTMINIKQAKKLRLNATLTYDYEADFLLRLMLSHKILVLQEQMYLYSRPDSSQFQCYIGVYDREWYFDSIIDFLLPLLRDAGRKIKTIPVFLQYYAMYALQCRFDANQNNRNRHVLVEEDMPGFLQLIRSVLELLDDDILMNVHDEPVYSKDYQFNRMFLRLKYGVPCLDTQYMRERTTLCIAYDNEIIYLLNKMKINILFMDYVDGKLEIDASVPDIFSKEKVSYYFLLDGEKHEVTFNEGYSLTKYFGISAYKRFPFHASIPLKKTKEMQKLTFAISCGNKEYNVKPEYQSHTSRLSNYPANSYWHFGNYIATRNKDGILIWPYSTKMAVIQELKVWKELLFKRRKHEFIFFLIRFAYMITQPYFKNKKIWMFYDKIYKGGDSSEYLYKYAAAREDGIKKYYLLDKKAADYKRLKQEGYKPLKRGSILHRLVFLNADMMIVSNSTVFAFNDFHIENSRFVRGITDFHVVCVQHGLSVQKIALAQQRLRDNTRLYFCASKYEIENLSHPVYNYEGYDALKLTGVPRYDGLVNRDRKQILISPTWRMQSAMLVSKNEGVARDYNPNFKETDYFKVYNSLINDERLIQAAQQYGYKIAYVLHPIVSPQIADFDRNPYVEIIPSTGEMSYEQLFCESSLMVTDYSGVQFDFAYMRKPLIYHHHRDLEAHYEEGTFHYDTMAFGEIVHDNEELIDLLIDYMANGCVMKDEYLKRADDFFAFNDHNNCQRIYDIMIDYQHNKIDKRGE